MSVPFDFEFAGGDVALDFANTVGGHRLHAPNEHLHSYEDLIEWGRQGGLLGDDDAERLREESRARSDEAVRTLRWAIALREEIYAIYSALAAGHSPPPSSVEALNKALPESLSHLRISEEDGGYRWVFDGKTRLDRPMWGVVKAAADLLTSGDLGLVRECASDTCSWLFVDGSRNHSRRWCDMKSCGNRDKVRRHLARRRKRQTK